jgi:hypothetical protein
MERTLTAAKLNLSKVDHRTVRLILAIISLSLFVLGAGAPGAGGGFGE